MKYSLAPAVTLASRGNTLIFEDNKGSLYDLSLDPEVHLALHQILLAHVDTGDNSFNDAVRSQVVEILDQLEQAFLVREFPKQKTASYFHIPDLDIYVVCLGSRSRDVATQLGGVWVRTDPLSVFNQEVLFVDSVEEVRQIASLLATSPGDFFLCEFSSGLPIVSPLFGNLTGLQFNDWILRRCSASWWPNQLEDRFQHYIDTSPEQYTLSEIQKETLINLIKNKLQKDSGTDMEFRIGIDGSVENSVVLSIPELKTPSRDSKGKNLSLTKEVAPLLVQEERLISQHTGVIRGLTPAPAEPWWPEGLHIVEAKMADIESTLGWPADRIAAGASWDEPQLARAAAIGEAVERYCGNAIPDSGYKVSSYSDLMKEGMNAIDPLTFALFSKEQYQAKGFPFVPFTREMSVEWIWGKSLLSGEACLAPAQLTYINWYYLRDNSSPTNVVMFAGSAAGPSRMFAEVSALEEIVERDAAHVWWHGCLDATGLNFGRQSEVARRMKSLGPEWQYKLFSIPSTTGIPVVGCLLLHKRDQLLSLGMASRLNAETAALKAIAEAVQLHDYARGLLSEDGIIWQAVQDRTITGRNLKSIREDRKYLESYRSDFRDVVDLPCQMQVYLDPRAHQLVDNLWSLKEELSLEEMSISYSSLEEHHKILLERISKETSDIVSVDLTTDDVRTLGLSVIRVLAPGMYGNSPTAFPYFGGSRLESVVKQQHGNHKDWQDRLRLAPPPYA